MGDAPVADVVEPKSRVDRGFLRPATREAIFWGYLMIAPTLIGLIIFYIWPVFQTIYFSFTVWDPFGGHRWTGLDNYRQLFQNPEVGRAFKNTFVYALITVPASLAIAIVVAVLLNQKVRGLTVYRTLYFIPVVTMPAAVGTVWGWLYNNDFGFINSTLRQIHLHPPDWLNDPHTALLSVALVGIWMSIGYNMILFLAGLQSIPPTYYEAASIDGAGPLVQFFRITLPLLTPTTFFALVISAINAFQVFDIMYIMVGSVPGNPSIDYSESVVYLFYKYAFGAGGMGGTGQQGLAAAVVTLLFGVLLVFTMAQFRLQRRWVHYE